MMKKLKIVVIGLVSISVIAAALLYFNLNSIVRRAIERQSTQSLNLQTTLDSARLSLLGGNLTLDQFQIASPKGFGDQNMLSLERGQVAVDYGQLRQQPIHIRQITLEQPVVVIEQSGGKMNFQALMDLPPSERPMKLVIDRLTIANAQVVLRPGLPGLEQEIVVAVPSLTLENLGTGEGAENGAAIKDVVLQVVTALAEQSGKLGDLNQQLQTALELASRQAQKQLDAALGEAQRELEKNLKQIGTPDGKQLNLDNIIGGKPDRKRK